MEGRGCAFCLGVLSLSLGEGEGGSDEGAVVGAVVEASVGFWRPDGALRPGLAAGVPLTLGVEVDLSISGAVEAVDGLKGSNFLVV